jgi:hypothetical protein
LRVSCFINRKHATILQEFRDGKVELVCSTRLKPRRLLKRRLIKPSKRAELYLA